jgi:soluble lytic murein transglycosylase
MKRYKIFFSIILLVVAISITGYFFHYHHIHQYDSMIVRISNKYALDPKLVRSVIYQESYFNQTAKSNAGAIGLMQITPIIVKEWTRVTNQDDLNKAFPNSSEKRDKKKSSLTQEELLIYPEINLQLGCWYLDQLMKRYSDLDDPLPVVLASYNAGPSNAQRWQQLTVQINSSKKTEKRNFRESYIRHIDFSETKAYVTNILSRYKNDEPPLEESDTVSWIFKQ